MSLAINDFYRFGEFTVDREQKVLLRNGNPLPLAPKVFDTLLILIDNSGRIVEKKELMNRLWPDTFVEESNLTFNIQQLRKALGDDARRPRFIETVARRGYRFIAQVEESTAHISGTDPSIAIAKPAKAAAASKVHRRSYLTFVVLGSVAVAAVGMALWFGRGRSNASSSSAPILSTPFKSEKFTTGGLVNVAITPDGKYVAYTSETGGKQSVWLRQLETSENIQIVPPIAEPYWGLVISHDGNSLFFVRGIETRAVYRVMTFGGIPVKITEKTEPTVSLSPDDEQLSFMRCPYREDDFCSLYVIDADGKNERKVLTRREPIRVGGAQFSPDGKSIAFASGQSWNGGSDFRLVSLDLASGTERALASRSFFNIRNLKWLPGGDGLLFTASEKLDGTFRIWHVSTATREARALTKDATDYYNLSLNQVADKLIATNSSNTFHLFLARIDDLSNPKSLGVARTGVSFGPDGKIIYEGNDGDIWKINQDGAERRQLTNNPLNDVLPRTSPDGRYVFFASNRGGSTQVWRMNADGSNQIELTKGEGGYPKFVTTDGKWVYFESGLHRNLWRVPTEGGQESQVLEGPVYDSTFSPDGKWVAYLFRAESDNNRFVIAVNSLSEREHRKIYKLTDDGSRLLCIAWGSENQTFYYVTASGSKNWLWRQSVSDERPVLIGDLGADDEVVHLAVSPDGTNVAFIRGRWVHDAVLIEGLK